MKFPKKILRWGKKFLRYTLIWNIVEYQTLQVSVKTTAIKFVCRWYRISSNLKDVMPSGYYADFGQKTILKFDVDLVKSRSKMNFCFNIFGNETNIIACEEQSPGNIERCWL